MNIRSVKKTWFSIILLLPTCLLQSQSTFSDSVLKATAYLTDTVRITYLYTLADQRADISLSDAKKTAAEGLALANQLEDEELEYKGLMLLGNLANEIPDFPLADSVFHKAIYLAEKKQDQKEVMKAKYGFSRALSQIGKWSEAIALLNEIIDYASTQGDSAMLAKAVMGKGLNYEQFADYETSLQLYYRALAIDEAIGDQHRIGLVHTNIGMTFLRLHRYAEALTEFQTAWQISNTENDQEGILTNTLNIGVVHQKLGEFDLATTAYQHSLTTAKSIGSWFDIAILTSNLGTVAMQQGRREEALRLLQRAYAIEDSIGFENDLPHTVNSLAELYLEMEDYAMAIDKGMESVRLSQRFQRRDQLSEAYHILSRAYAGKQQYAEAYDYLLRFKTISDSVYSAESDKAISNLKIQYETTLKENKIKQLTSDNIKSRTTQHIYLWATILVLITGASLIYALMTRRNRDKVIIAKERELHELQNRFFANISHEFRTPLTLILAPIHHLIRQFKGTKEESAFRGIQKNADRLLHLINEILDLAKLDKNVFELHKEVVNASRMIKGVCSSFDSLAASRHIQYSYDLMDPICLEADVKRLEIVMINLISNAFKFTPDFGIIKITGRVEENDHSLILLIADSGSGISPENLPRIFDRYYHDDRESHADVEGVGIGLALSKQIIDLHGGKIEVVSKIHEGSTFAITLPAIRENPADGDELPEEPATENDNAPNDLGEISAPASDEKPMILVVEDRKDMREYIISLLQQDYQIREASDANKGFQQATEFVPDIIISDVMMPGKSGLELCRELKSDVRTSHIPVILLTALSAAEDHISGLETEADVYITKPFIPEVLLLNLRNLLASRKRIRTFYEQHRDIDPGKMSFNSVDEQFLQNLITRLEAHFAEESFSVEELSSLMNLSRSQLHRKLSALTGQAPNRLIRTYRLKKAYEMIKSNAATISEIAYTVGFNSPAYFTKCFVEEYGATPAEIRDRILST